LIIVLKPFSQEKVQRKSLYFSCWRRLI